MSMPGKAVRSASEDTLSSFIIDKELVWLKPARPARVLVSGYPLTAPEVMPATICRLKMMYKTRTGIVISKMLVNSRFH